MVVQGTVQWCLVHGGAGHCAVVHGAGAARCKWRCNIMAGWRVGGNALVMHNLTSQGSLATQLGKVTSYLCQLAIVYQLAMVYQLSLIHI